MNRDRLPQTVIEGRSPVIGTVARLPARRRQPGPRPPSGILPRSLHPPRASTEGSSTRKPNKTRVRLWTEQTFESKQWHARSTAGPNRSWSIQADCKLPIRGRALTDTNTNKLALAAYAKFNAYPRQRGSLSSNAAHCEGRRTLTLGCYGKHVSDFN
jgi:hypothetical protein